MPSRFARSKEKENRHKHLGEVERTTFQRNDRTWVAGSLEKGTPIFPLYLTTSTMDVCTCVGVNKEGKLCGIKMRPYPPIFSPAKSFCHAKHKSASNNLSSLCTFASLPAGAHQPPSCKGCFMKTLYYNDRMGIFYQSRRQHENIVKTSKKSMLLIKI